MTCTQSLVMTVVLALGYQYCDQLIALEKCGVDSVVEPPDYMSRIVTPMKVLRWRDMLATYPDKTFANFLLRGIENGFRVGFANTIQLKSHYQNLLSAMDHPAVVQEYLERELEGNRVIKVGSLESALQQGIHCSPFGVIPKKHKPDAWRLIVDLSHPENHSVNDGINKELCSLSYVSLDDVITCIILTGKGTLLAKMDIKQAYRNVPVHPQDRRLLGMFWKDTVYVDATLPFGLRSAPLIFQPLQMHYCGGCNREECSKFFTI